MLNWLVDVTESLSAIRKLSEKSLELSKNNNREATEILKGQLIAKTEELTSLWKTMSYPEADLSTIRRHVVFAQEVDFEDILRKDVYAIEDKARQYALASTGKEGDGSLVYLLHPSVIEASLEHYRTKKFRNAVFDGVLSVFDLIRKRSGLDLDGTKLIEKTFSLDAPYLIVSDLDTESGKNEQKGFLQILSGVYVGIRNPKAHTLNHDLDSFKSAQYLIMWSLLARRIDEAKLTDLARREILSSRHAKKSKKP